MKTALVYPAFMACVSVGIVIFLFTFVIPKITKIFEDTSTTLPFITVVLIWISNTLKNYWWLLLASTAGIVVLYRRIKVTKKELIDAVLLKDPTDESSIISSLTVDEVDALIKDGTISGGMAPKIKSAEEALLSCMVYVDLNPIRAGIDTSPETSDYTSIQERIRPIFCLKQALKDQLKCGDLLDFKTALKPLLHFEDGQKNQTQTGILFSFQDYLELVDWTGRMIRNDKRGYIDNALPPILSRLQITPEQWKLNTTQFEAIHNRRFNRVIPNIDTG